MRALTITLVFVSSTLCACAGHGPLRVATESSDQLDAMCRDLYSDIDGRIADIARNYALDFAARMKELTKLEKYMGENTPPELKTCWTTSYENHPDYPTHRRQEQRPGYDLFYAEFDDSGDATDLVAGRNVTYPKSELHLIKEQLQRKLAEAQEDGSGLNIVVFTHGWHGTASAFDDYSIEFKGMLEDIADEEQRTNARRTAQNTAAVPPSRRTIGIEVAWRGDSFLNPAIPGISGSKNFANVWDRKITASVIASGSVHELFAFLNEFYREHSCEAYGSARGPATTVQELHACDSVHMLTIGHSFGALIDMRAITGRIESGLNVPRGSRVYGFGDLSVLLNPAFEGVGYRGVFDDAVNRAYNDLTSLKDPHPYLDAATRPTPCQSLALGSPGTILKKLPSAPAAAQAGSDNLPGGDPAGPWEQIPTVVILQSQGDTATGKFFPPEQAIATMFRQTLSPAERIDKNTAVGWIDAFRTHQLDYNADLTKDRCVTKDSAPASFCPFIDERNPTKHYLQLTGIADSSVVPDFMPLWSVMVNKQIMAEHDDFWNPQIVRLISIMFRDAYVQAEVRNLAGACESQPGS
jgi:hypothetical protein